MQLTIFNPYMYGKGGGEACVKGGPPSGQKKRCHGLRNLRQRRYRCIGMVRARGQQIQNIIRLLGLENEARYLGFLPEGMIWLLYRNAIRHWFTPCQEDFGLTPTESMSQKTPVIAYNDVGARYTFIDGDTGLLVDPKDAYTFAEKTAILLDQSEYRNRMGQKGREHVLKHFTWKRHFEEGDKLCCHVSK